MSSPTTCYVCGTLITEERGGTLIRVAGEPDPVSVHPACRGASIYVPKDDAYFAYLALDDPIGPDSDGWETHGNIESQRGFWSGSDAVDFEAGLSELVDRGWAEQTEAPLRFRLTSLGHHKRSLVSRAE